MTRAGESPTNADLMAAIKQMGKSVASVENDVHKLRESHNDHENRLTKVEADWGWLRACLIRVVDGIDVVRTKVTLMDSRMEVVDSELRALRVAVEARPCLSGPATCPLKENNNA